MPTLRSLLITLVIASFFHTLHAQTRLEKYLEGIRKGGYDPVPEEILKNKKEHPQMLTRLQRYEEDSVVRVRSSAYSLASRIGQSSADQSVRQRAIDQLLSGIGDPDGGISGNCTSALTGFQLQDFAQAHKKSLALLIKPETSHLEEVVKLVGFLQMKDQIPAVNQLMTETRDVKTKWAIRITLIRLGDLTSKAYLLEKLKTAPMGDNFVYDVVPDLVYTRNPEVFDFLESIIMSDEKNCQTADPDRSDKILCGYRVMELVAIAIRDFPIRVDEYGEAQVSDYKKTLEEVRSWFATHGSYDFKMDVY